MSKSKYQKMNPVQIINELDLFNKAIQYHYDIENEALNTDDVYNGKILGSIADELAENDDTENEYRYYEKIANDIMNEIADDLATEICDRDRGAMEYENERREAMKGDY